MRKSKGSPESLFIELMQGLHPYRLRRQRYWDTQFAIQPEYILALRQMLVEAGLSKQENQLLHDHLVRAKADLDNFRKRTKKEREEIIQRANEGLITDLLNVLDHFEMGFKAAGELDGVAGTIVHGIKLTYDELLRALSKYGLERIETEGKTFDPYYHEAAGTEHNKDLPDNQITQVMREGYIYKGKVVRPAMIKVNKKG